MNIIGRTTRDAFVNTLPEGRKVVHFSIAVNDYYRPKGGEPVKATTYYDCAYWIAPKLADYLKQGTLVEVGGRVFVSPYISKYGEAKASLKCHVSTVKIHTWPKNETPAAAAAAPAESDDLPF